MIRFLFLFLLALSLWIAPQNVIASTDFKEILQKNAKLIQKSSSKTVEPVLAEIQVYGTKLASDFLLSWKNKDLFFIKKSSTFVYVDSVGKNEDGKKTVKISDAVTNEKLGTFFLKEIKQIKPNSGVRAKIASALVPVLLESDNILDRQEGLATLRRNIKSSHLLSLKNAIEVEIDEVLKKQMEQAYIYGLITHGKNEDEVEYAIYSLRDNLSLEARAALNPLLSSKVQIGKQADQDANIARIIVPESTIKKADGSASKNNFFSSQKPELTYISAYQMLVDSGYADPLISSQMRDEALMSYAVNGRVGEFLLSSMNTEEARNAAYGWLSKEKNLPPLINLKSIETAVSAYVFYAVYDNPSERITNAAREVLAVINGKVLIFKLLDLALDGLSLASIYFLAAIGLAITFGVMRVINMAHGEFIMMGAYTGYVIQLLIPSYTASIILAIPAAFCVTFFAGVLLERVVIRHLYKRPLETLLATFGISIALQQIAKNIFGTQARPLTSPTWLDGALVFNDVLAISNIRIAIFVLGLLFLSLLLYVMTRTRFGLETRAVTQNSSMAASMGINPERINMLTFGFGSGIAGIAGVAIGLFSKVTSELGSDYIVQSFMTVVVGGVGNIWGTLAGAAMIGSLQKGIEWFNPSNTLAAQTYMIIFIILFIQFKPRGIFALKGRAAED